MKRIWMIYVIGLGGFATGVLLPVPERCDPAGAAVRQQRVRAQRVRETRKRELLGELFDSQEQETIRIRDAANLSELFGVLKNRQGSSDGAIARMIEMDPAAAMAQVLADSELQIMADNLAEEWARRDPRAAVRFLRQQPAYQAESALCKALVMAYCVEPDLVGETLRAMDRRWQARNLRDLFGSVSPLHPLRQVDVSDPFVEFDKADFVPFGTDLLDCLADDELRNAARNNGWADPWGADPFRDPGSSPEVDPDDLNPDRWSSKHQDALKARWQESPEETLAEVAEMGGLEARRELVGLLIAYFPTDPKQTAETLRKLEQAIQQLGVIPESMPREFWDPAPWNPATKMHAEWLARQPLALQRAWVPAFTGNWAKSAPQSAIDWARTLPPGSSGELAVQRGFIVWAHREPMEAAKYVEALPPGDLREAAISDTAATWSNLDPAGARTWLQALPASPGKERGMARVEH
jgi:hypothetical protein